MSQTCPVCQRQYIRKTCEFCRRGEKWDALPLETRLTMFPPRIVQELPSLTFPEFKKFDDLYLWGPAGAGKTMYAAAMIAALLRKNAIEQKYEEVEFITLTNLLFRIKDTFRKDSKETEYQIVEKYSHVDWLILDDFGANKETDWTYQIIYLILNNRYEHLKKTIITSNHSIEEWYERSNDERILSRIAAMCEQIHLTTVKRRLKK